MSSAQPTQPVRDFHTKVDEDFAKNNPDAYYEGGFYADEDDMDYVNINLKGVRL